jgi:uncharacterized protein with HEPN domain
MKEKARKYLYDMLRAIELIESFVANTTDFDSYSRDLKTQSAVERQLAIIGEALNKFRKEEPAISFESEPQIIAFRNRLIRSYDSIDNSIVWVIIRKHLVKLKADVQFFAEDDNA